jgi:hypothetical protein
MGRGGLTSVQYFWKASLQKLGKWKAMKKCFLPIHHPSLMVQWQLLVHASHGQRLFFFFGGPFCAVAKVVMIKIWLQAKYESKKFEHPSIFVAYLNHVEDMEFVFQKR